MQSWGKAVQAEEQQVHGTEREKGHWRHGGGGFLCGWSIVTGGNRGRHSVRVDRMRMGERILIYVPQEATEKF